MNDKNIQAQVYHDCLEVIPCSVRNKVNGENIPCKQTPIKQPPPISPNGSQLIGV